MRTISVLRRARCALAFGVVVMGWASARADFIYAPTGTPTAPPAEGNGANVFPFSPPNGASMRMQQVYSASQFSLIAGQTATITAVSFRRDAIGAPFSTTLANVQLNMATTSVGPDSMSSTFASNIGGNEVVVKPVGPVAIVSTTNTSPRQFEVTFTFTTPFQYNPSMGNLLLDIRNFQAGGVSTLDTVDTAGDSVGRVVSSFDNFSGATATTGNPSTTGLVTRFTYTVPEPALGGPILLAAVAMLRRRKSRC